MNIEAVGTVSPEELRERLRARHQRPVVLDVRDPDEFTGELGHIEGAILIPLGELSRRLPELEPYRPEQIVTVCKSGKRSATAAAILVQAGFPQVASLAGGMAAWVSLGYCSTRA